MKPPPKRFEALKNTATSGGEAKAAAYNYILFPEVLHTDHHISKCQALRQWHLKLTVDVWSWSGIVAGKPKNQLLVAIIWAALLRRLGPCRWG